jgi:hypothetical protein
MVFRHFLKKYFCPEAACFRVTVGSPGDEVPVGHLVGEHPLKYTVFAILIFPGVGPGRHDDVARGGHRPHCFADGSKGAGGEAESPVIEAMSTTVTGFFDFLANASPIVATILSGKPIPSAAPEPAPIKPPGPQAPDPDPPPPRTPA